MDAAILHGLDGVGDLQELAGLPCRGRSMAGQGRISYAILIIADGAAMAIERGWLVMHDSGTFVRFTQPGADLFA